MPAAPVPSYVPDSCRLLDPDEVCAALGIQRSRLFEMFAAGDIRSMLVGRLRRVSVAALAEYVAKCEAAA